jgi:hypothetical protein
LAVAVALLYDGKKIAAISKFVKKIKDKSVSKQDEFVNGSVKNVE